MVNYSKERLKELSTYVGLVILVLVGHEYYSADEIKDAFNIVNTLLTVVGVGSITLPGDLSNENGGNKTS